MMAKTIQQLQQRQGQRQVQGQEPAEGQGRGQERRKKQQPPHRPLRFQKRHELNHEKHRSWIIIRNCLVLLFLLSCWKQIEFTVVTITSQQQLLQIQQQQQDILSSNNKHDMFLLPKSSLPLSKKNDRNDGNLNNNNNNDTNNENNSSTNRQDENPSLSLFSSNQQVSNTNHNNNNHNQHHQLFPHELKLPTPIIVMGLMKAGTTSIYSYFRCGLDESVLDQLSHYDCKKPSPSTTTTNTTTTTTKTRALSKQNKDHPLTLTDDNKDQQDAINNNNIDEKQQQIQQQQQQIQQQREQFGMACGRRMRRNIDRLHKPAFDGMDQFYLYTELDAQENGGIITIPQWNFVTQIHDYFPNATWILNLRSNPQDWLQSINQWKDLRQRLSKYLSYRAGFPSIITVPSKTNNFNNNDNNNNNSLIDRKDEDFIKFYNMQAQRIRDFVANHPSHTLVEVPIDQPNAGQILEDAFGISSAACWRKRNVYNGTAQWTLQ